MYKLSVFLPSIRSHLLETWYKTLSESCNRHDFEVVFCGPFPIPQSLSDRPNVKWIQDYGSPTRCAQRALLACTGECVYHTTDDCLYYPGVLSDEIDGLNYSDIVAIRYREGQNHSGTELDKSYWFAGPSYGGFRNVNPNWMIGVHFLAHRDLILKFGGFDCEFQYLNHATHSLLFSIQANYPVKCRVSKKEGSSASWEPERTGSHEPIHEAQVSYDSKLFIDRWHFNNGANYIVDKDNWKKQPDVWNLRFNSISLPEKYEDLKLND